MDNYAKTLLNDIWKSIEALELYVSGIDRKRDPFGDLLSVEDVAKQHNIDTSTVRKAITDGRLRPGTDCKLYGKSWVITMDAAIREFGHHGIYA